ncbi:MAG: hypothetical protein AB1894_01460 [Chloroflexota bacterium]
MKPFIPIVICMLLLSGCGLVPVEPPTPTKTITPTPACQVKNGKWGSKWTVLSLGSASHTLTFTVYNCTIISWVIWTFPLPGELLWWTGLDAIPIIDNQFSHEEDTGDGVFTLAGSFDSATSSHGTLFFPKGFSVFGAILTKDVTFPWTAAPAQ